MHTIFSGPNESFYSERTHTDTVIFAEGFKTQRDIDRRKIPKERKIMTTTEINRIFFFVIRHNISFDGGNGNSSSSINNRGGGETAAS